MIASDLDADGAGHRVGYEDAPTSLANTSGCSANRRSATFSAFVPPCLPTRTCNAAVRSDRLAPC